MSSTTRRLTFIVAASTALLATIASTPAALAAAPSTALAAQARPRAVESSNWAGYAETTGTYTSVSANWIQPSVTCTSATTYSSDWVGLDGYSNSALEQTGTEADCVGGQAEYGAWWEVLPASESPYSVTVRPGDHISASVTYNGGSTFTMTLTNSTEGWTKSTTHAGSSGFQNTSAEVISEATGVGGQTVGSPSYTITFNGCTADGSLFGSGATRIESDEATLSAINGGTFTVTWDGSGIGV